MEETSLTAYKSAAATIKTAILQGQYEAAKGVNRIQLTVYFAIGKYISLNTRRGKWGTGAIEAISQLLRRELPGLRGFSATQMKEMRLFYEAWIFLDNKSSVATDDLQEGEIRADLLQPHTAVYAESNELKLQEGDVINIHQSITVPETIVFPVDDFFKVPFTHHSKIRASVKDVFARYYYIHRTAEEHLSVEALCSLIKSEAYAHRDSMPNNFASTMSDAAQARKAVMMFKDEYLLDFINVEQVGEREAIDVDERVVEQQIVQDVKQFIMTFGRDFAFIGNQYHLEVYGVEHFPDLLFFNRELNAMVVVELKTGEFKTSYLGQLMGYLSILDAKVKKPHENPSIGIVLCRSANREYVEFVIRDYNKPMGVATYTTTTEAPASLRETLPNMDELKKLLR
ncbi:MAG: DUF1016 family protein [Bacteroidaceae bacterium]|nr:DUF1016 family protein [Bacteroidaceae bacterium]